MRILSKSPNNLFITIQSNICGLFSNKPELHAVIQTAIFHSLEKQYQDVYK